MTKKVITPFIRNFNQKDYRKCYDALFKVKGTELGCYLFNILTQNLPESVQEPYQVITNIKVSSKYTIALPHLLDTLQMLELTRIPLKLRFGKNLDKFD